MNDYLVIKHKNQHPYLVRDWGGGIYEYYHGIWSNYSDEPVKFPSSSVILSTFKAENNKEALSIYNLLEQ